MPHQYFGAARNFSISETSERTDQVLYGTVSDLQFGGYGFIKIADKNPLTGEKQPHYEDAFVHCGQLIKGRYPDIYEGMGVLYQIINAPRGPRAFVLTYDEAIPSNLHDPHIVPERIEEGQILETNAVVKRFDFQRSSAEILLPTNQQVKAFPEALARTGIKILSPGNRVWVVFGQASKRPGLLKAALVGYAPPVRSGTDISAPKPSLDQNDRGVR